MWMAQSTLSLNTRTDYMSGSMCLVVKMYDINLLRLSCVHNVLISIVMVATTVHSGLFVFVGSLASLTLHYVIFCCRMEFYTHKVYSLLCYIRVYLVCIYK